MARVSVQYAINDLESRVTDLEHLVDRLVGVLEITVARTAPAHVPTRLPEDA